MSKRKIFIFESPTEITAPCVPAFGKVIRGLSAGRA